MSIYAPKRILPHLPALAPAAFGGAMLVQAIVSREVLLVPIIITLFLFLPLLAPRQLVYGTVGALLALISLIIFTLFIFWVVAAFNGKHFEHMLSTFVVAPACAGLLLVSGIGLLYQALNESIPKNRLPG